MNIHIENSSTRYNIRFPIESKIQPLFFIPEKCRRNSEIRRQKISIYSSEPLANVVCTVIIIMRPFIREFSA